MSSDLDLIIYHHTALGKVTPGFGNIRLFYMIE